MKRIKLTSLLKEVRNKNVRSLFEAETSGAGDDAERLGLTHIGWGRYTDQTGKVVAKSIDGRLVRVEPSDAETPEQGVVGNTMTGPDGRAGKVIDTMGDEVKLQYPDGSFGYTTQGTPAPAPVANPQLQGATPERPSGYARLMKIRSHDEDVHQYRNDLMNFGEDLMKQKGQFKPETHDAYEDLVNAFESELDAHQDLGGGDSRPAPFNPDSPELSQAHSKFLDLYNRDTAGGPELGETVDLWARWKRSGTVGK